MPGRRRVIWRQAADTKVGGEDFSRSIYWPMVSGEPAEAMPWPLPDGLGIAAGDLRVLALPDAVIGYRQAE